MTQVFLMSLKKMSQVKTLSLPTSHSHFHFKLRDPAQETRRAFSALRTVCAGSPPARGRRWGGDDGFRFLVLPLVGNDMERRDPLLTLLM